MPKNSHSAIESSDTRARPVFFLSIVMMILLVIILSAVLLYFQYLNQNGGPTDPVTDLPTKRRRQSDPAKDYQTFKTHNETILNSYGWIDRKNGVIHIPITEAMTKMVHQEGH